MEALGIDVKLLIAQLVNFGLSTFLIAKYVVKPFKKFMREQSELETDKERLIADISSAKETADKLIVEAKDESRKKAEDILADANLAAVELRSEILTKAKNEANDIIATATKQMHDEQKKLMGEVKYHITSTAKELTRKALSDSLSQADQERLVATAIKSVEKLSQ